MTTWAPAESVLRQITEDRTWLHPDCLLPIRYDSKWGDRRVTTVDSATRERIMRRERDRGHTPDADGWLYYGGSVLDYNDGLKLFTQSRIRWEWSG